MERRDKQLQVGLICLLALLTFGVYSGVLRNDYVNFDDYGYVKENAFVQQGLTSATIGWAFTSGYASNWHPITWISHMIDCLIFGINHPGGHHFTNLLFHVANTILLFIVLRRMTGAVWRSALVAALFAWHPLHVETVAWISERKDVLSAFFGLLALLAYVNYVNALKAQNPKSKTYYRWMLVMFALGLMSKPMLVTLPFVLLLLDYWPLQRIAEREVGSAESVGPAADVPSRWRPLVEEKLPLFAFTIISSFVTFLVQNRSGAVMSIEKFSPAQRIGNALLAYCGYLGKMIWPVHLGIFYPFPPVLPPLEVLGAFLLLALITIVALKLRRSQPYLIVGWLWFLGTLVPVIGLVQVGSQAMADRYSYLPLIGIFIALVWGLSDFIGPARRNLVWAIALPILAACLFLTWKQVQYWHNTETVFRRALAVTKNNALAHISLGRALDDEDRPAEALGEFMAALNLRTNSPIAFTGLGVHYAKQGDVTNAIQCYNAALRIQPANDDAHYNLGNVFASQGKYSEAAQEYEEAVRIRPDSADALNNLGAMYMQLGRFDEALKEFTFALNYKPYYPEAQDQIGSVLLKLGRPEIALEHFAEAVRLKPDFAHAQGQLGLALARAGRVEEAIPHFQAATNLEPQNAQAYFNLAAAYSAIHYLNDAVKAFAQVIKFRPNDAQARSRMAWILASTTTPGLRNGPEAVRLAEEANQLTGYSEPDILGALDVAYAEVGRFDEAIKTAQKVQEIALAHHQKDFADEAAKRIELYRSGKPFRE